MMDPNNFDEKLQRVIDKILENIQETPLAVHLRAAFGCWVSLITMYVLFSVAAALGADLGPGLFLMMAASLITIWLVRTYYNRDDTTEERDEH